MTRDEILRSALRLLPGGPGGGLYRIDTRSAEVRNTSAGNPWLLFGTVADGVRLADEAAALIRVEYFGDDAEALAPRLLKNAEVYVEGRLSLWEVKGGRTGLSVVASHVEVLGQAMAVGRQRQ